MSYDFPERFVDRRPRGARPEDRAAALFDAAPAAVALSADARRRHLALLAAEPERRAPFGLPRFALAAMVLLVIALPITATAIARPEVFDAPLRVLMSAWRVIASPGAPKKMAPTPRQQPATSAEIEVTPAAPAPPTEIEVPIPAAVPARPLAPTPPPAEPEQPAAVPAPAPANDPFPCSEIVANAGEDDAVEPSPQDDDDPDLKSPAADVDHQIDPQMRRCEAACRKLLPQFDAILAANPQPDVERQTLQKRAVCRARTGDSVGSHADSQQLRLKFGAPSR